jgi:ribokinase
MSNNIVVVGSLNMDLVVRTQRHPKIGETVLGYDFQTYPGGKGANQAVSAARLGSNVKMIGRVGRDNFGATLLEKVNADGIDAAHILIDQASPTGVAFITVDERGQNTIVVASGANGRLSPEDIANARSVFEFAAVLLLQLECPLSTVEQAIKLARKTNTKIVLNPAPAQLLDTDLLQQVDYLIPNQTELILLAGQESISAAVDVLLGIGVKNIVVTLGEAGALVVDSSGQEYISAYEVPVVDTTAAGDAFAGAFAVALCEGRSISEAARWGNAAGALTVMHAGAQPSLPYRDEFLAFLSEN